MNEGEGSVNTMAVWAHFFLNVTVYTNVVICVYVQYIRLCERVKVCLIALWFIKSQTGGDSPRFVPLLAASLDSTGC